MSGTHETRDLLVVSHLRWNWVWQRPQHLVSRLAAQRARAGLHTWFVEEPLHADVAVPTLRTEQHEDLTRVWLDVPHGGDGATSVGRMTFGAPAAAGYGVLLRRLLRDHGVFAPDVWMYTPMGVDLLCDVGPYRLVYDVMDDLSSFRNAPTGLQERQQLLLQAADVVFTGGRSLHEGVLRHRTEDVHLFPSGVESAHYAAARSLRAPHERPVAGYVGVIDERLDLELVGELAALLPGWTLRMVGPTAKIDGSALPQAPNIQYSGMVAYVDLPAVMAGFDVALMPFALNESTRSISPTKTLEYLAAGLPVLSTRVPDVVETYGHVVHLADDASGFAYACEHLLVAADGKHRDRLAAPLLQRQEWDSIAAEMVTLLAAATISGATPAHDVGHNQAAVVSATPFLPGLPPGRRRATA